MTNAWCSWSEKTIHPSLSPGHTGTGSLPAWPLTIARGPVHLLLSLSSASTLDQPPSAFPDCCPGPVPDHLDASAEQWESSQCQILSLLPHSQDALHARHWLQLFTCIQPSNPHRGPTRAGAGVSLVLWRRPLRRVTSRSTRLRGWASQGVVGPTWPYPSSCPLVSLPFSMVQPQWPLPMKAPSSFSASGLPCVPFSFLGVLLFPSPSSPLSTYLSSFTFHFQCHFLERSSLIVSI